jgi:hypothetical protein
VLPDSAQLYDRANDPLELDNLFERDPQRLKEMAGRAFEIFGRSGGCGSR